MAPAVRRQRSSLWLGSAALAVGVVGLAGCRDHTSTKDALPQHAAAASASVASFYAERFSQRPSVAAMTALGRSVFFDAQLSASGKMSCATCHDPRAAYGPPNERSTQLGGPDLKREGVRAVPSLRYLQNLPRFAEHHFDEAVDESVDQGPTGGHTWDGRVDTTHDQARLPFTSPFEMANDSMRTVVEKVAASSYGPRFRDTFGADVFADPERGSAAVLLALEVFQQSPQDFYPYSSRYDAWLRHKGELSARELRGLALFNDPKKGNCTHCHPSEVRQGAFPQFTDYGLVAIGVPRNAAIVANADPHHHDLGLCGPYRTDLSDQKQYCGAFRAPTLRNASTRRVFFHNGVFHRLEDVLAFYAQRDTNPKRWYPVKKTSSGNVVDAFNDLPDEYRTNVNREAPFGRASGSTPALSKGEIDDIVVFLETLTDADVDPTR